MRIVVLGLSITSSWGNGHATNYRALVAALAGRGHDVLFLERDVPWYAEHRDAVGVGGARVELYGSLDELREQHAAAMAAADLVVLGSYVPDGRAVASWTTATTNGVAAFYDIDTPVTLAALASDSCAYLERSQVGAFDLYLSFTSGPALDVLRERFGARRPRAFHCLVDDDRYRPTTVPIRWDLGYLGTYSDDRQPALERLLLEPARRRPDLRFVVAGPQYPDTVEWPANVERIEHLPPSAHPDFYAAQRLTLNVTRSAMVALGWSPSVRLFEAASCAVPVVSDVWEGIDSFFEPDREILLACDADDVLAHLDGLDPARRERVGTAARARVLAEHTADHRAGELERLVTEVRTTAGEAA